MVLGIASGVGVMAFGCSSKTVTEVTDDAGPTGSSGTSGSSGKTDSGSSGKTDSGTSGNVDSGSTSGDLDADTGSCPYAAPASTFAPKWVPPAAHKDACTQANIDLFRQNCVDGTTQAEADQCTAFSTSSTGKPCAQCIITPLTGASYGPIIAKNGVIQVNVAGCLALATGDSSAGSCAAKMLGHEQCDDAACPCTVKGDADFEAYKQCTQMADAQGCKTYNDGEDAACASLPETGPAAACLAGQSFDDLFNDVVPLFCLKGADAGGGGG